MVGSTMANATPRHVPVQDHSISEKAHWSSGSAQHRQVKMVVKVDRDISAAPPTATEVQETQEMKQKDCM